MSGSGVSNGAGSRASTFRHESFTVPARCLGPSGTSLYRDFFDWNQREEGCGGHGFDPGLGDDSDNEKLNDIESRVLVPGRGKLGTAHERCSGHAASSRVVLRGIDSADGSLRIAIIKSNESLTCSCVSQMRFVPT